MAIKLRSEENKFELYRDKKSATNTMLFLALATIQFLSVNDSLWFS
jgi:hypothetical protein